LLTRHVIFTCEGIRLAHVAGGSPVWFQCVPVSIKFPYTNNAQLLKQQCSHYEGRSK